MSGDYATCGRTLARPSSQPVTEVDGYQVGVGGVGPITRRLEAAYHDMVRGRSRHSHWRTPVCGSVAAQI
ncbi:MAG: hypothetical protein HYY76_19620 [Acidobacteria bacterium]|nr:hypothetical protein [Acidobacteriota bacterium]